MEVRGRGVKSSVRGLRVKVGEDFTLNLAHICNTPLLNSLTCIRDVRLEALSYRVDFRHEYSQNRVINLT